MATTSDGLDVHSLIHRDDENSEYALRKAREWELEQGYPVEVVPEGFSEGGESAQFNYEYRDFDSRDVPLHHKAIANMAVRGLSEEEIIATRKESRYVIRRVLGHYPVKQYVLRQLTLKKMAVEDARLAVVESRRALADKGFTVLGEILDGEKPANNALVKAAAEARALHPERVYEPVKDTEQNDKPHDTTTLDEFFERFKRKKVQAEVVNAQQIENASVGAVDALNEAEETVS